MLCDQQKAIAISPSLYLELALPKQWCSRVVQKRALPVLGRSRVPLLPHLQAVTAVAMAIVSTTPPGSWDVLMGSCSRPSKPHDFDIQYHPFTLH